MPSGRPQQPWEEEPFQCPNICPTDTPSPDMIACPVDYDGNGCPMPITYVPSDATMCGQTLEQACPRSNGPDGCPVQPVSSERSRTPCRLGIVKYVKYNLHFGGIRFAEDFRVLPYSYRARYKLGGKNLFVLCLLDKNRSAVYSADRCDFKESEKAVPDLYWIGGDISIHKAHNSGHIGYFRYPIPVRQV